MPDICGIDEAGRGPLVGPVMAACVLIPEKHQNHPLWKEVADSKKLSAKKREYLYELIIQYSVYGIAKASTQEIDSLNIHHATLLAMKRSYENMGQQVNQALIDGRFCPNITCPSEAVVKGDSKHVQIAAASILAKVTRDRLLAKMDAEYPVYGWARNAGYGTKEHLEAIEQHGITPYHRLSFAPCRKFAA